MKAFLSISFLLIFNFTVFAQESEEEKTEADEIIDLLFDEDGEKSVDDLLKELFKEQKDLESLMANFSDFKFLYMSLNYNSNTFFGGRDIGINQYNLRPQISYIDAKGFFAGVSGAFYQKFSPQWDFTSVSVGYGKSFGKDRLFRVSGSYARFFYSKGVENPFDNSLSVSMGLRNKKLTLGTRLSANYSFGSDDLYQFTWSTFGVFNIKESEKYRLQFRPRMSLNVGQQFYYEEDGTFFEDGIEYINHRETKVFDLINIQFNIPLLYTTESWDVELGYNRNLPNEIKGDAPYKNTGFVNLSIGYLMEL